MSFYKTATASLTNGSAAVTGAGTAWVDAGVLNAGDIFLAPGGVVYEILSIQSNTGLTLASNYLGTTVSGSPYAIIPIGLLPSTLALRVKEVLTEAQADIASAVRTTAAQGLTTIQQNNARANILALGAGDVGKGLLVKSVAGGVTVTLTAAEAANQFIELTGALTANINLVVPAAARLFVIRNSTTGAYTVTVKTAAGTGVTALQGGRMLIECDGTNCVDALSFMRQTGGSIDGTPVGATTPAAGSFTTLGVGSGTATTAGLSVVPGSSGMGSGFGALYPTGVTPGAANYVFGARYDGASVHVNAVTGGHVYQRINDAVVTDVSGTGLAVTGALSATGALGSAGTNPYLSVIGQGGAFQAANKFGVDHYAGNARIYSSGPNTSTNGGFEFHSTRSDGSNDFASVTLDAGGHLLVGTTSNTGSSRVKVSQTANDYIAFLENTSVTNPYGIRLNYTAVTPNGVGNEFLDFRDATAQRFKVLSSGNVQNVNNSYGAISDLKLKENITDATPKLAGMNQIRVVNYNLKTDPLHKQIGVIAQELELIFPGLIEETPDYIEVTKTRGVPKTVDVTVKQEQPTQHTVIEIVDGKAVQTVSTEIALIDVQVFDEYLVFDAAGNIVLELETPEIAEVLDDAGAVVTPFKAAVYRQAVHKVARTQTTTEIETYTERELTGTVTKSVKYSVFIPMLIKAMQEQQAMIEALTSRITTLETA